METISRLIKFLHFFYLNQEDKKSEVILETGKSVSHELCLFVDCLTSQQQASVSQGRICSDNCTCCHTEIEVAHQTFYLTQSQYTDTGPTGPSADPITPSAWQGSHCSASFLSHWYDSTPKKSRRKRDWNPGSSALEADALPTRPTRRSHTRCFFSCPCTFFSLYDESEKQMKLVSAVCK